MLNACGSSAEHVIPAQGRAGFIVGVFVFAQELTIARLPWLVPILLSLARAIEARRPGGELLHVVRRGLELAVGLIDPICRVAGIAQRQDGGPVFQSDAKAPG